MARRRSGLVNKLNFCCGFVVMPVVVSGSLVAV